MYVASLILCSTISSSYSSLDPLCYDHQLTGLYLVRQLTINSLLIRQYIQSNTSTQLDKISSLTEVTLTQSVNTSSPRRSADVPTPFHRLATTSSFFGNIKIGICYVSSLQLVISQKHFCLICQIL